MGNQHLFAIVLSIFVSGCLQAGGYGYGEQTSANEVPEKETAIRETPSSNQTEQPASGSGGYKGQILAGTSAPLLDFNKADYDKAIATNKLVVLYFYANWCPICREEVPKMYDAFNELTRDDVIGFRVNYKDSDTDTNEEDLARQYGVSYQHTKVFVKNGERVLKAPDSWDKQRYLSEISKYA